MRILGLIAAMAVSGCASPAATPQRAPTGEPPMEGSQVEGGIVVPAEIPALDVSKHSVPLEQIYFDTFQPINRAVPLTEATPELIERLRDAIPPIHNPKYELAGSQDWLRPDDVVLGYTAGDQAWAYPIRILNLHEIVNDELGGEPVLVSYCPLCYSGIVFSRRLGDRVLTFGNTSALYESDLVMLDYETGSYWWQVAGEAIVGPLTGKGLSVLPSAMATWEQWRRLHPNTLVLSRETGSPRNYDRDPFIGYDQRVNQGQFAFPVGEASLDGRLAPGTVVLAVKVGEESKAYPLSESDSAAYSDVLGGEPIVVFLGPGGSAAFAYSADVDGRALTFEARVEGFTDLQTESLWNLRGEAIAGPLRGSRLEPFPSKTAFWFSVVAADPETGLFTTAS